MIQVFFDNQKQKRVRVWISNMRPDPCLRAPSSVPHPFLPPHRHNTSHHGTNKPPCCNNFWLFFHFSLPQQIQLLFLLPHCHWTLFRYSFSSLLQFLSSLFLSLARDSPSIVVVPQFNLLLLFLIVSYSAFSCTSLLPTSVTDNIV